MMKHNKISKNNVNGTIGCADVFEASAQKYAKTSLSALVARANEERACGYTDTQMQQMTSNLLFICNTQVRSDANRLSRLHSDVSEAASTMCELGMRKMASFAPEKASFSTWLTKVFVNACCTEYRKCGVDACGKADSLSDPIGDDDGDDMAERGDLISHTDCYLESKRVRDALTFACNYALEYAQKHLSENEHEIFMQHVVLKKSNIELVAELCRDRKSIENAAGRALSHLRREALPELNKLLSVKFGFRDLDDLLYTAEDLRIIDDTYTYGMAA